MARSRQRKPAPNAIQELIELARDLELTALADALPSLLHNAQEQSPSFTDFTLSLLRTECNARTQRRLERGLERSHLGVIEGLDGFDFTLRPKLDPRVILGPNSSKHARRPGAFEPISVGCGALL